MKKVLLPIALCLSMLASASVPQTITYQAVVRNNVHKLVRAKAVGVRISILKGSETGTVVYSEIRQATTNINGLLTFAIGDDEAVTNDDLSAIKWGDDIYFIKCEMDPTGGSNYSLESTSQLMSVPYAIYAERISSDATPAWTQTPEKPVYNYSEIVGAPDMKDVAELDPEFKKSVAAGISAKDTARWNKKLGSYTETDPEFKKSAAAAITQADIDKWNNKQDEFAETDPLFANSVAAGITGADTIRWNKALNMPASVITNVDIQNWNNKLDSYTESDPAFAKSIASTITEEDIRNWNSKMSDYTETDPAFSKSLAAGITAADTARWNKVLKLEQLQQQPANNITKTDIQNWNNKLDSYTETDPAFAQSVAAGITKADTARWNKLEKSAGNTITQTQINLWNNKLDSYSETDPFFRSSVASGISKADTARWNKAQTQAASTITENDIQNWNNKLAEETDPAFSKSLAAGITAADTARWNLVKKQPANQITTADIQNWNNKLAEETDPAFSKSLAAGITAADTARWNKVKQLEKQPANQITTTDIQNWNNKLAEETDPAFNRSLAAGITAADTARWNKVKQLEKQPANQITTTDIQNWNNKLAEETDPAFNRSLAAGITAADTARWNLVKKQPASQITTVDIQNWNNKLDEETDPVYGRSLAAGITAADTARWNKFAKSSAATITSTDIEYWNDIVNQFPVNVSEFVNDKKYVTQSELNLSNNTMYNMMFSMEKYYEDSLMAVTKNRMETYVDSVRSVQQNEMAEYQQSVSNQFNTVDNKITNMPATGISSADIANWNNKLAAETDPAFNASVAAGITAADVANWNGKISSFTESDPEFAASVAANIKAADTLRWSKKLGADDLAEWAKKETKPTYDYSEITNTPAEVVVPTKVSKFENDAKYVTEMLLAVNNKLLMQKAMEMEKHFEDSLKAVAKVRIKAYTDSVVAAEQLKIEGYKQTVDNKITTVTNTVTNMPAAAITATDINNWNNKVATETDPEFTQSVAAGITAGDVANWNSKLDAYTETDPKFAASEAANITAADVANWNNKLDAYTETDPKFAASEAAKITATDVANWNNKKVSYYENDAKYITKAEFDHYKDSVNAVISSLSNDLKQLVESLNAKENEVKFLVTVVPSEGGTVSGGGSYVKDAEATIKALPETGYEFVKWNDGNMEAVRTMSVSSDLYLVASFKKKSFTVSLTASPSAGGSVVGNGVYDYNSTVVISATPKTGYIFKGWSDGVADAERTVTVKENVSLTASFVKAYTVTLNVNPDGTGTVTGGGDYESGSKVTIKAVPADGYAFVKWSDGSTFAEREITVTDNVTLKATFESSCFVDLGLPSGAKWASSSSTTCSGGYTPSQERFNELRDYCTKTNVAGGVRFTGPNGNSIVLPNGFYMTSSTDSYGFYRKIVGIGYGNNDKQVAIEYASSFGYTVWKTK